MQANETFTLELPVLDDDGQPEIRAFGYNEEAAGWVAHIEDIDDEVETLGQETAYSQRDGAISARRFRGTRSIAADLFFYRDATEWNERIRSFDQQRFQFIYEALLRDDGILLWQDQGDKIWRRIEGLRCPKYPAIKRGKGGEPDTAQLQLVTGDPLIHSAEAYEKEISGTSGSVTCENYGSAIAWPTFEIEGPFEAISIFNSETSQQLDFAAEVAAGASVTIDPRRRTAKLSTGENAYSGINRDVTSFFGLRADNTTTLNFASTGGGAGTKLTVRWRAAWSG